jgi:hypothetical protein
MSRDGYPVACHFADQQLLALLKHIVSHNNDQQYGQGWLKMMLS